jgi:hypothetical protein
VASDSVVALDDGLAEAFAPVCALALCVVVGGAWAAASAAASSAWSLASSAFAAFLVVSSFALAMVFWQSAICPSMELTAEEEAEEAALEDDTEDMEDIVGNLSLSRNDRPPRRERSACVTDCCAVPYAVGDLACDAAVRRSRRWTAPAPPSRRRRSPCSWHYDAPHRFLHLVVERCVLRTKEEVASYFAPCITRIRTFELPADMIVRYDQFEVFGDAAREFASRRGGWAEAIGGRLYRYAGADRAREALKIGAVPAPPGQPSLMVFTTYEAAVAQLLADRAPRPPRRVSYATLQRRIDDLRGGAKR